MTGVPNNLPGRVGATNNNTYYDNRTSQTIHNLTRGENEKSAFIKGHMKDTRDDVKVQGGTLSMEDLNHGYGIDLNSPGQKFNEVCKEAGINRWSSEADYKKLPKETLEKMLTAYTNAVGSGDMSPQETTYQTILNALRSK